MKKQSSSSDNKTQRAISYTGPYRETAPEVLPENEAGARNKGKWE